MQNSSPMELKELVDYLDQYLETNSFSDASANGLQVEGCGPVKRVGLAVDACLASILQAAEKGCNLLIVHHGLLWGEEIRLCGHTWTLTPRWATTSGLPDECASPTSTPSENTEGFR